MSSTSMSRANFDLSRRKPGVSACTTEDLTRIGTAHQVQISLRSPGGSLRPFVTIWAFASATTS